MPDELNDEDITTTPAGGPLSGSGDTDTTDGGGDADGKDSGGGDTDSTGGGGDSDSADGGSAGDGDGSTDAD